MDVVKAVQGYITKIVNGTTGIKVLLLDNNTVPPISLNSSVLMARLPSYPLQQRNPPSSTMKSTSSSIPPTHFSSNTVASRLENSSRDRMRHLKCICFVRPTASTIQLLVNELREPKYGEYSIYFSNIVKKSSLERMAEADDHEVVKQVQEFYADYLAITKDVFCLSYPKEIASIFGAERETWNADALEMATEGVLAVLLSLKKRPLIRYERNSAMAKKLATEIQVLLPDIFGVLTVVSNNL